MDTIENLARIKTTDIKRLEMARKRLKISGTFISRCLDLSDGAWSLWVREGKKIPEKYLDKVANIFSVIESLQSGKKCLPVATDVQKEKRVDRGESKELILDFLKEVADPKMSIFGDKYENLTRLLKHYKEEAETLLEILTEEDSHE